MTAITESERKLIAELRQDVKASGLASPVFDQSDYNYLRFVRGWQSEPEKIPHVLKRHLKSRKVFDLDNIEQLEDDEIVKHHFPSGFLGTTGKDNNIVMIETAGRTDIEGILKCVQGMDFVRYRMKFFERLFQAMNKQAEATGRESQCLYIFDLDGITFDPFLLPTLNGAYRILWGAIFVNYPEWVDKVVLINVPTFFNVIWAAFGPLLPGQTREKVKLLGKDWKQELLEYADADHLPVHWGGKMVDENGDPMYRSKIVVPQGKIPESLYWRNSGRYKEIPDDQTKKLTIGAGSFSLLSFFVPEPDVKLEYYITCPDDYTFAIFYAEDVKETDLTKMYEIFPWIEVPGNLAPDSWRFKFDKPGAYHIKFGNEKAWFLSVSLKYRFEWKKSDGTTIDVVALNGTGD